MTPEFSYVTTTYRVLTGCRHGVSETRSLKGHPGCCAHLMTLHNGGCHSNGRGCEPQNHSKGTPLPGNLQGILFIESRR